MAKFRSKPTDVDAFQLTRELIGEALFDGASLHPGLEFRGEARPSERTFVGNFICHSRQGEVSAEIGDWIIVERGAPGLVYPCKPDVFEAKYEPVEAVATEGQVRESFYTPAGADA